MIKLHLQAEDLARMRLAYSPLLEMAMSFKVAQIPSWQGGYQNWLKGAQENLQGVSLPYMHAVITPHYIASYLMPTPLMPIRDFGDEVTRLKTTSAETVRQQMLCLLQVDPLTPTRQHFLDEPLIALEHLVTEVIIYWKRTLEPHWRQMMSILENAVLHQAHSLALRGTEQSLNLLADNATYEDAVLQIDKPRMPFWEDDYYLRGDGVQLVPALFKYQSSAHVREPQLPMVLYNARGFGLLEPETPPLTSESLQLLIGDSKARVLEALQKPRNTQELAQYLSLSTGAISQHLKNLHQTGLVESYRSGYYVFYRLTQRGHQFLELFSD